METTAVTNRTSSSRRCSATSVSGRAELGDPADGCWTTSMSARRRSGRRSERTRRGLARGARAGVDPAVAVRPRTTRLLVAGAATDVALELPFDTAMRMHSTPRQSLPTEILDALVDEPTVVVGLRVTSRTLALTTTGLRAAGSSCRCQGRRRSSISPICSASSAAHWSRRRRGCWTPSRPPPAARSWPTSPWRCRRRAAW